MDKVHTRVPYLFYIYAFLQSSFVVQNRLKIYYFFIKSHLSLAYMQDLLYLCAENAPMRTKTNLS